MTRNWSAPKRTYGHPTCVRYKERTGAMVMHTAYYKEATCIPSFWCSGVADVDALLATQVNKGSVTTIGRTAGGHPIRAVSYGNGRKGRGTTTFSGAVSFRDASPYVGPDSAKRVVVFLAGVHGGEFEGIVGLSNLISVMETGIDLRGQSQPGLTAAASMVDRIVIVPIVNVDGRLRVPLKMQKHWGTDNSVYEYFNTGCWKDGTLIGWPECKRFIPLDFAQTEFPGGYPNDNGINIQHDDFLGNPQPEVKALLQLAGAERPDLIVNLHTGVPPRNYFTRVHRPFTVPHLTPMFDGFYRFVHTALTEAGLQDTGDAAREADPRQQPVSPYNLDTALSLHCGALSVLVESPAHSYDGYGRDGRVVHHSPERIVDAQLIVYKAALQFLGANTER